MRRSVCWLLVALSLALTACPRDSSKGTTTAAPDPAMTMTMWAVLIADAEGVTAPKEVTVEASAMAGALLLVEAPALLVDRPPDGWRRWTRIGDAAARARLGNAQWLLDSGEKGHASVRAILTLTEAGASDPEIVKKLQDAGAAVHGQEGEQVIATIPKGAWGALLKLDSLESVAPE